MVVTVSKDGGVEAESGRDGQELEAVGGADEAVWRGRKGVAVADEGVVGV